MQKIKFAPFNCLWNLRYRHPITTYNPKSNHRDSHLDEGIRAIKTGANYSQGTTL